MMKHIADDLTTTVEEAVPQLRSLHAALILHRPGADRWTIKEVIGHLIDSAANNHQRFVRAQFVKELVTPRYDRKEWVGCQCYNEVEWSDLIELWRRYNLHLAHIIRHVPETALMVPCTIGDSEPVTLQFLIEDYLVHTKHHLAKIAERVVVRSTWPD